LPEVSSFSKASWATWAETASMSAEVKPSLFLAIFLRSIFEVFKDLKYLSKTAFLPFSSIGPTGIR